MFNLLKNWFKMPTEEQRIDAYLGEAVDLIDLENRQRQIDRGHAPWHTASHPYKLDRWV